MRYKNKQKTNKNLAAAIRDALILLFFDYTHKIDIDNSVPVLAERDFISTFFL